MRFTRGRDGENPYGSLTFDGRGGLYGATAYGGHPACRISIGPSGCGIVFDLVPSGSGYVENVLFRFRLKNADGVAPIGNLIVDANGTPTVRRNKADKVAVATRVAGPFSS